MPELFAFKKDHYTGELWDFSITSGPTLEDEVYDYVYSRNISFSATSDGYGRMLVYFPVTESDLRPNMQIRNFRDAAGTEIIVGGEWQLTEFEPVLNIFDKVHAYRTRLSVNVEG